MFKLKSNPVSAVILILILLIVLEGGYSGLRFLSMSSLSYTTGYEGVKARFAGVSYDGENFKGTGWSSTFNVDFDEATSGLPDVAGEMTSVFVPSESVGQQPTQFGGFDLSQWLVKSTVVKNPVAQHEWELTENDTTTLYVMEEWELRWFASISCEPAIMGEVATPLTNQVVRRNRLLNVEVWMELDLAPIWYFEGQDTSYFAIAQLKLAEDVALGGRHHKEGYQEEKRNPELSVTPYSRDSLIGLYHGLFASEGNRADKQVYEYKGKKLNPDLFTDKVYAKITLNDFGVTSWYAFGTHWRADVATFAFKVRVFVIGQWTVKDVQDLPDVYGRTSKTGGLNLVAENPLVMWFGSPEGRLLTLLLAGLIIFLILAIGAPSFLLGLFVLFGGKRRR